MENKNELTTVNDYFKKEAVREKFTELLGSRSVAFMTTVLQIVNQNEMLRNADPFSVFNAARVAAVLDLPVNPNLGFAYILPYNQKMKDGSYGQVAQCQIGYRGFIQLALRSGQFKTISSAPVHDGQLIESNPLTGYKFDWAIKNSGTVIGYVAYFALLNGFEKSLYMTTAELQAHGVKYSKSFAKGYGLWKDNFDAMASKTVLKLLLARFAPLSIEMQKAVIFDQAVVGDDDSVTYSDHADVVIDKEAERVRLMIQDAETIEQLDILVEHVSIDQSAGIYLGANSELFNMKKKELTKRKNK